MTRAELLAALAGVAVAGCVVDLAALAGARAAARAAAARAAAAGDTTAGGRARRWSLALGAILRRAGVTLEPPAGLAARLAAAGLPDRVGPGDAMTAKLGAALAGVLVAATFGTAAPGRAGLLALVVLPPAGFLAPDVWLARLGRRRARVIAGELPEVLDLLRVVVGAGLPPARALGEVGARRRGLLATELARVAAAIAVGVPRSEATRQLTRRCPLPAVIALAAALERADRHGAPLAPSLRALAADARADRARRIADHAARAGPKIQLVVALLLVPAVLALVAAAMVSALA